ncbi:Sensor protein ZraS [Stieleria neptunia]|uniref:histidine kinase n=1 Tax=Stieleria neptunia TaxID=2527979 RepID=A0A518I3D4_9BACT|nr:response regulator [Stieleria neptunia]QDV47613.1 Sensor protein ZraS [Stieleria neptunia]
MKILIADDSAMMRHVLVESLKQWDYEIVATENGAEAWERYQKERFPLVLSDWMMPEMDGLELVSRIRSSQSTDYTYIILLTAKSEKEDLVHAMEAGADDFLIKPCDTEELRVRVREGERIIRLEQSLAEQNRRLRETQAALVQSEKLAGLGQLAAGMAHEINNPISIVANNLSVLRREVAVLAETLSSYRRLSETLASARPDLADEIRQLEEDSDWEWTEENLPRLFESSSKGLKRVRDIVNNLRDFARLDEAELDQMDVNAALQSTRQVLAHKVKDGQVTVELCLRDDLPGLICHPAKIHQVLYNLLLNGIQATAPGGRVIVRTSADDEGTITVEVEDHGSGIEAEHLPRIFDPFFTTRPVGGGTGLGLAISYGIVRDHGGTIEVESEMGRGSTFRVMLPPRPKTE